MRAVAALLLAALALGCGDGAGTPPSASDSGRVDLTFLAELGGEPFACGRIFAGIGTTGATIEPGDLRFYVSDFRLVREDGSEEPVVLDQDGVWQVDDLALLDFEDATAAARSRARPRRTAACAARRLRARTPACASPSACRSRATTATPRPRRRR